jgi:Flp pilus assembly CpaE family ATPase
LGLSPQWRIPSDFHAVQRAQNAGIAVAEKDSAVTRVLKQMARAASGKAAEDGKKKKFGLF